MPGKKVPIVEHEQKSVGVQPFARKGVVHVNFLMDAAVNSHYLEKVVTLTLEQGWAVSKPRTGTFLQPTDAWGFPRHPDETAILPPDADLKAALAAFVTANAALLDEPNCWLGTWVNPETNAIYLDVTTSCQTLGEVLEVTAEINARSRRKIIAVYNSALDETIYL